MPLIVAHQCHHHQLNLTFFIPYLNKCFSCDICHNLGSKQWLYRCNLCEFDAHLDCATAEPKTAPVQAPIQQVRAPILQGQVQYYQRAPTQAITQYQVVGTPMVTRPPMQSFAPNNMLMAVGRSNQQGYPLLNQVLQGLLGVGGGGIDLGSILRGGGVDFGGLGGPDFGGSGSS
ncbi:hypothetical protein P3X46_013051 [Hevea brasiliensis]|uniref:DC1 domain-containing protein n=2 Tax=Hevea brasiliensis TaxID=3981 RepID=A0ABQ9M2A6_HEVBR|nr:hypothetical protein P3X46_013051 [Hevea brasiliensis]